MLTSTSARRAFILSTTLGAILGAAISAQGPVPRDPVRVDSGVVGTALGQVVHSDGARVAVAYLDGGNFGEQAVHVAVSTDGGVSFAAPVRVDNDATGAPKFMGLDSLRVSGDRIYVIWRDTRFGSATDDLFFNYSDDGGLSYQSSDQVLGDGAAGANEVFDWRFEVRKQDSGDDLYVLESAEIVNGNFKEELFLLSSLDGGVNWSSPVLVGGDDAAGVDVDQLALAIKGTSVHMIWENDPVGSGLNDVLYQRTKDAGVTLLPSAIVLDSSDTTDIGDADSGSNRGISIAVRGQVVLATWLEKRASPTERELRIAASSDGGSTWGMDTVVGDYSAGIDDVGNCSALVNGSDLIVAWDDNRDGPIFNKVFAARSTDGGVSFQETEVSGVLGGGSPRLSGSGVTALLSYTTQAGSLDRAAASYSSDSGATWASEVSLSDNSASDSDGTDCTFDGSIENALVVYLNDAPGSNGVYVNGFSLCSEGTSVVRNAAANPLSLGADIPLLGNIWTASVDLGTTGHGFAAVFGFNTPLQFTLLGGQVLLVNVADPGGEILALPIAGGNPAQFSRSVPNLPSLCGLSLSIQAVHFGSVTPFALSNAVDLKVAAF